nr:hypothetical protein [Tanacetum cinerariifolium]
MSFNLDEFSSIIGLKYCENCAPSPLKETVRDRLATLRLVDEKDTSISSTDLVNSSSLRTRYFSPTWRVLMVYIVKCLGATSFKKPSASEVPLTSYMLKVAKLSPVHEESLILPSGRVNADDTVDKSLFGTSVQPLNQPKAPTDKKTKKKKNLASSKPKISKIVKESSLIKQVADTQHAEEPVASDTTKELYGHAEESPFETESKSNFTGKEFTNVVADSTLFDSLFLDEEIKEADSDLKSMPDDEIMSMSENDKDIDNSEELSKNDEIDDDKVIDELVNMANIKDATLNVFVASKSQRLSKAIKKTVGKSVKRNVKKQIGTMNESSDAADTILRATGSFPSVGLFLLKWVVPETLSPPLLSALAEAGTKSIKRTTSRLWVAFQRLFDAIAMQLPDLLSTTLKDILPQMLKDSVKQALPKFDKRVKKTLKAGVDELVLKPLNKEFNALNTMERRRFVILQKQLSKDIKKTVGKSV